jgi:DNA-binding NtrC family response regulator
LQSDGYEVVEASEGEMAIEMVFADSSFLLALVDVRMEPVGGFEFIREIRGKNIDTPVVLITGDQTGDLLEQAGKLGVAAVLMKPVMKDRLIQVVERTLGGRR